jgi:hypothetical protein
VDKNDPDFARDDRRRNIMKHPPVEYSARFFEEPYRWDAFLPSGKAVQYKLSGRWITGSG